MLKVDQKLLKKEATFKLESQLLVEAQSLGLKGLICGIDEVGRGALAGPVVACAAAFPLDFIFNEKALSDANLIGIKDSKKLTHNKRVNIAQKLNNKISYALGSASVLEIDQYNILQATMMAMKRAFDKMIKQVKIVAILVDGKQAFDTKYLAKTIVKGDSLSITIASASIIAKVNRDRMMQNFAIKFTQYDWESNKGYGTYNHISAIKKFGITSLHRTSFEPIKSIIKSI